jgi:hypothetical protein
MSGTGRDGPRFAYLVLTHKEPRQVEALAARILALSPRGEVVVHHDAISSELPWDGRPPARVHLVDRGRVLWGDWSMVEATLRLVRYALEELRADWFVVLSGEHWPVTDLDRWERTEASSGVDAFVEAEAVPRRLRFGRSDEGGNMYLSRCIHRWITVRQPRRPLLHRAVGGLWKLSLYVNPIVAVEYSHRREAWFFGRPRRRGPVRGWTFYKGSQWIAFNRRSAETVLATSPAVTAWFRRGHIPDETYLHTILRHADHLVVTDKVVTYVPVGPKKPVVRWMVLKAEDLPSVWASGAAFARKVDLVDRPGVVRAIDAAVDRARGEALDAITAPAAPAIRSSSPSAPCSVAVVGMHRSGTSAMAGMLVGLGLAGPSGADAVAATESNERGHWESETVHMCNVRILAALESDTYAPPPARAPGWEAEARFDVVRSEARQYLTAGAAEARPTVLKDPRLCITYPLWKSALGTPLPAIFVIRDPLEVALSLQARDDLPIVLGLALWDRYVRSAALGLQGAPTLVVDYAAVLADPVKWTDVVCGFLEDLGLQPDPRAKDVALSFLDGGLRHQDRDRSDFEPLVGAHREVHAVLEARAGTQSIWSVPDLPPEPPWADYVLELRREVVAARHELYWTRSSRVFRAASAAWRVTGGGPRPSAAMDDFGGAPR